MSLNLPSMNMTAPMDSTPLFPLRLRTLQLTRKRPQAITMRLAVLTTALAVPSARLSVWEHTLIMLDMALASTISVDRCRQHSKAHSHFGLFAKHIWTAYPVARV